MLHTHRGRLLFCAIFASALSLHAQKNKSFFVDSAVEVNSDKWKAKLHRGLFGMAKPAFGPYSTIDLQKTDAPVFRNTTKDSSYTGGSLSSDGWDWDISKFVTVERKKPFYMQFGTVADTAQLLFSIYTISKEKQLTFLGELLSKNDEGKNERFGFRQIISGMMAVNGGAERWRFVLEDSVGTKDGSSNNYFPPTKLTTWYAVGATDSLYCQPLMGGIGKPGSKYYWESQNGVVVKNNKGEKVSGLKFGIPGDLTNAYYVWIRRDLPLAQQNVIAAMMALTLIAAVNGQ